MGIHLDKENEFAISDILTTLRSDMFINEKKLYLNAIDKLYYLDYYGRECKNGEKVSLFRDKRLQ